MLYIYCLDIVDRGQSDIVIAYFWQYEFCDSCNRKIYEQEYFCINYNGINP